MKKMNNNQQDGMKELLNWAVANSSPEELRRQANSATSPQVLTPENRAILEYIAGQMRGNDPIVMMKEALRVIQDQSSSVDDTLDAIDQIDEIVSKIDFANDFHKMKGPEYVFEHFLSRQVADVRADDPEVPLGALQLICTCLHNNPKLQVDELYQIKLLDYLEEKLEHHTKQSKAMLKKIGTCLVALSSNQSYTLKKFVNKHTIGTITHILNSQEEEQILTKFMFCLLSFMIADHGSIILGEEVERAWESLKVFIEKVIIDFDRLDLMEKTALFLKECARYPKTNFSFVSDSRNILEKSISFIKLNANNEDKEQLLPYFEVDNIYH